MIRGSQHFCSFNILINSKEFVQGDNSRYKVQIFETGIINSLTAQDVAIPRVGILSFIRVWKARIIFASSFAPSLFFVLFLLH